MQNLPSFNKLMKPERKGIIFISDVLTAFVAVVLKALYYSTRDRLRAVSLFSVVRRAKRDPSSKTRDTQMATRARVRALPLLNRKKKRDCSQSILAMTSLVCLVTSLGFSKRNSLILGNRATLYFTAVV